MNMWAVAFLYASGIAGAVYLGLNGKYYLALFIIFGLSGIRLYRENK
jgi:hypothetical protein